MRQSQPGYPNENDILTLGLALDRAPQLAAVRFQYARALVKTGKGSEAIDILKPLANNPHGSRASALASRMISAIQNAQELPTSMDAAAESQISEPEETPERPPESTPASASE